MDLDLNLGQWIIIGLSAFLFVWFFIASAANRKQGIAIYRWLRRALGAYGDVSQAEWIGASNMGARLLVDKAASPLRRARARYLLEPREFLPYWLASRLRGKRDRVVIQLDLRRPPSATLEIGRVSGRRAETAGSAEGMPPGFQLLRAEGDSAPLLEGVQGFLASQGATVERLLLQRQAPHLELEAWPKPLLRAPADAYLSALIACCKLE